MTSPIPVTVVGGYLGSGKTTLVNNLLRNANDQRLAILVNDFGELPIDAALIEAQDGDIISLSGGCVCCSYGNDLTMALLNLQELPDAPDQVVVEASGVALPGAIAQSLTLLESYSTEGIVVLADAASVMTHAMDRYLADTIMRQLRDADLVVLNKSGLVDAGELESCIRWIEDNFSDARVLATNFSAVPNEVVLGAYLIDDAGIANDAVGHAGFVHNAALFTSVEIALPSKLDVDSLASALANKQCGLVRAKGFVRDLSGNMKTIQVVGQRWSVSDAPKSVSGGIVCIGLSGQFSAESVRHFLFAV